MSIKDVLHRVQHRLQKFRLQPISVYCLHHISKKYDKESMYACDWTDIESFKNHIITMRHRGVQFISLSSAFTHLKNDIFRTRQYVVITIDDGYKTVKEILPWLEQMSIPVTLFINGKYLDGKSYRETPKEKYLTKEDLFAIKSPLVEVAHHGWQHTYVTEMDKEEFVQSAELNIKILSSHPNYVPFWAYAYGRYTIDTNSYLQSKRIIPVYVNGEKNYTYVNGINRELMKI